MIKKIVLFGVILTVALFFVAGDFSLATLYENKIAYTSLLMVPFLDKIT